MVMAACIAAHHQRVKVWHVEAGLRTFDRLNSFPEEIKQAVTDHNDMRFVPTYGACDNLLKEGISRERIFVTGNTVIDALTGLQINP